MWRLQITEVSIEHISHYQIQAESEALMVPSHAFNA